MQCGSIKLLILKTFQYIQAVEKTTTKSNESEHNIRVCKIFLAKKSHGGNNNQYNVKQRYTYVQPGFLNQPAMKKSESTSVQMQLDLGKYGLFAPLLGKDRAWFVLCVRVISQLWRTHGHRAAKEGLLQIVEHWSILLG